jgi:hypothetical protein
MNIKEVLIHPWIINNDSKDKVHELRYNSSESTCPDFKYYCSSNFECLDLEN